MNARLTRIAVHEAAHAVIAQALHDGPEFVSIVPNATTLGRCIFALSRLPDRLVHVYLAGHAAQHRLDGRGAGLLIEMDAVARLFAAHRRTPLPAEELDAMRTDDLWCALESLNEMGVAPSLRALVEHYDMTVALVAALWEPITSVARALLSAHELDRKALDAVLEPHWETIFSVWPPKAVAA